MDGLASFAEFGRALYFASTIFFIIVTAIFIIFLILSFKKRCYVLFASFVILYVIFLFHHFWYYKGEFIVKNIQGGFFCIVEQYDKAADAYIDIQYDDSVYEKLLNVYNKGVEHYFNNKKYRKCIDFIDKIERRYDTSLHNHYSAPWENNGNDYILKSYRGLYDEYRDKNNLKDKIAKQKLFDLITEIKNRYKHNIEILNKENGFYFDEDFNKYDLFEYLNEESTVYFGKIGLSEAGLTYNKIDRGWRLLYKEDNKVYLICSAILVNRYMNELNVDRLIYKKTDMYKFLNEYLYNEMFDEKEKKAIIPIDGDENISLLSEEIINNMIIDGKGKYLNSLISRVPISYLVDIDNGGPYQHIWIKSDIKNYCAKYVVTSSNDRPNIYEEDANDSINVLPIICVNLNIIEEYAKEERIKQNEIREQEEIAIKENEIKKIEQTNTYNKMFTEKIEAMKSISEYPDEANIDDFDSILIGNREDYTGKDIPINWILLEKTGDKALLLSKYSLYPISYDKQVDYESEKNGKSNYKDFEDKHSDISFFNEEELKFVLDTKIVVSKNDIYPENNDLSKINCKTFLLGIDDIKKYFTDKNGNILKSKLKTYCDELNEEEGNEIGWWLKDTGEFWWTAAYIDENGNINERGYALSSTLGYRSAMWVKYR